MRPRFRLGPQRQLALIGDPADTRFQDLAKMVHTRYDPRIVIAGGPPGAAGHPILHAHHQPADAMPTAYLCQAFTCKLPTTSPEELRAQLEETP